MNLILELEKNLEVFNLSDLRQVLDFVYTNKYAQDIIDNYLDEEEVKTQEELEKKLREHIIQEANFVSEDEEILVLNLAIKVRNLRKVIDANRK